MKKLNLFTLLFAVLCAASLNAAPSVAKNGMMPNAFTVNDSGKKVWFSQGNLQHSGTDAAGTWSFAENQYDRYATDQTQDHRDLFGWGTKTAPNNTSTNDNDYAWAEWGENKITNGGNMEGVWSTLTADEWQYLFNRTNYRTMATVHNMPGLILMPDGWTATTVNPTITLANYTTNVLTDAQWTVLEGQGCIFLPVNGWRNGTGYQKTDEHAIYWTSTTYTSTTARDAYIDGITHRNIWTNENHGRHLGFCVRLVVQYWQGSGTVADPYLIKNTYDWNKLCYLVKNGHSFSGKYFRQTADITISERTATFCEYGPQEASFSGVMPYFEGTYDGDGYIMNLNIHETQGDNNWIATSAPFGLVRNATFKNMHITGETSTNNMRPASLVGFSMGNNTIINCWSEVAISSTYNNDIDGGAFVARLGNDAHFDIIGCLFTGSITYSNATGYEGGGFVGWTRTGSTVTLTDCVFAPSSFVFTKKNAFYMFVGGGASHGTMNNCYYNGVAAAANLTLTNVAQEKRIYTITPGTDVTVAPAGTPTTYYDVSTIAIYGSNGGLSAGGVLYGKNADAISLNLDHEAAPTGYSFSNYSANNGTVTGSSNPYTLTMTNANSVIDANFTINQYTITFNSNGGSAVDPITQDYNTAITAPADPTRDYYTFAGWSPALPATMPAEDIELTAQWTPANVTLNESDENLTTTLSALYTDATPHDITITRSFVTGIYNTFCLPFDLSASEIANSPLAGATLKNYDGADVTGEGAERNLNLYLSDLTEIEAGKPFLIKPETDIVNPTFENVTIDYYELMGENIVKEHVDFQGILASYDLAAYSQSSPDYLGVGQDGRLYWADASKSTGLMRAFRAFFHVKDAGSSNNAPVRRGMHAQFVESSHQMPTDVEMVQGDNQCTKLMENGVLYLIINGTKYTVGGAVVK